MQRTNPYRRADHFTREAKIQGYPARSVFKLEEIDRRVLLLRQGQHVLDLGAAPGSWSMYAASKIGPSGRLLAIDLQPLRTTLGPNATFVLGDALTLQNSDLELFAPYDLVLSDMAPNTTGNPEADGYKSCELLQRAIRVACALAKPGSSFAGKVFMSEDFEKVRAELRATYSQVRAIRPEGTRRNSVEIFLIGLQKKS